MLLELLGQSQISCIPQKPGLVNFLPQHTNKDTTHSENQICSMCPHWEDEKNKSPIASKFIFKVSVEGDSGKKM